MTQGAINYSPWIPSDLHIMISTDTRGIILNDLKHTNTILLGPQLNDLHESTIRPQIHRELITLILRDIEGITQIDG